MNSQQQRSRFGMGIHAAGIRQSRVTYANRQRGILPPVEYTLNLDEAIKAAGLQDGAS